MNPPRNPRLSGADLAAQLAGTSFPKPIAPPEPPPPPPEPQPPAAAPEKPVREKVKQAERSKGGRPSKVISTSGDTLPVNVRLAMEDHTELAKLAVELMTPGRPMPTVQDVVRSLVRGALQDHEGLKKLARKGGI